MTINSKNQIMRNTLIAAVYLIFFMAGIILFTMGPRIEVLLNPVIGAFKIDRIWQEKKDDGKIHYFIQGALLKTRAECSPVEISMFTGGGVSDENAKTVKIIFDEDPINEKGKLVSRPAGDQHWGPWELVPPQEPLGPIIRIVVRHRCHALWEQSQTIFSGLTRDIFPGLDLDDGDINEG